ncbi:hypothetical protein LPC08_03130 [Roseomonas sp. OT10]|uniref:dienelactone hydrolase family protein n=1 Tax=Roseomonas cutis TaxID=2897332 RepID=UPI001E2A5AB4|nr:hypothetical protein [Roseomonas sp. OT10]UFN49652.1 hypothetical protein LPC08_03130 [Roseomonas sp. OT10]
MSTRQPSVLLTLLAGAGLAGLVAGPAAARAAPAQRAEVLSLRHDLPGLPPGALAGLLIRPAGTAPYPAAILLDDGQGLDDRVFALGDALLRRGWAVLEIELHPHPADGDRPATAPDDAADAPGRIQALHELIARLAEDGEIDAARLAVIGWGAGGRTALMAGAEEEATSVLGPFGPRPAAHVALYPGCAALAQEGYAEDRPWSGAPVAVLWAGRDARDPPGACASLRRGLAGLGRMPRLWHDYPLATYGWDYGAAQGAAVSLPIAPGRLAPVRQDSVVSTDAIDRVLGFLEAATAPTGAPTGAPAGRAVTVGATPVATR